ncbi:MAG TPA: hypothetical protein VGM06_18040 [Polyangiaceae bacterium]
MGIRWAAPAAALCFAATGTACSSILGDFSLGSENSTASNDDASDDGHDATGAPLGDATMGDTATPPRDAGADATLDGTADAHVEATVDAGADASADAGLDHVDASPACVGGGACAPNDCAYGTLVCADAGVVCQRTGDVEAGTTCSAAADAGPHVCSSGTCVACNAGGSCSDPTVPCVKKTYDCSSGSAVCTVAGNVTDGTPCDAGLFCNVGVCSACEVGSACPPSANPCHVGKVTACDPGAPPVCTDQGTNATAGVSCTAAGGADGVCDGDGACVACTVSAQCNPGGNTCQVGQQMCAEGPQCVNPAAVDEGRPCGATGDICHAGACVACGASSCPSGCCSAGGCVTTAQTSQQCGNGVGGATCAACMGPSAGTGSATCTGNACSISCSGTTPNVCGTRCVNEATDNANCGACGNVCGANATCTQGVCLGCGAPTVIDESAIGVTPTPLDDFGASVALGGNTLLVGAPGEGNGSGAVWSFTGPPWTGFPLLVVPPGGSLPGSRFGQGVAISGATAVVLGLPTGDGSTAAFPTAYVFTQTSGDWFFQTSFPLPQSPDPEFDFSPVIALDGSTLVASANFSASVYVLSGSTWTLQQTLEPSDFTPSDANGFFGNQVAISGNTAVIGATQIDSSGNEAHFAYVFVRSGSTWTQQAKLVPTGLPANNFPNFFTNVSIVGDTAFLATFLTSYVFTRSGTAWTLAQQITAPAGSGTFSYSVAMTASAFVSGAPSINGGNGNAYLFANAGGTWIAGPAFASGSAVGGDGFGMSVAVNASTLVVGSPGTNVSAGSIFIYGCSP